MKKREEQTSVLLLSVVVDHDCGEKGGRAREIGPVLPTPHIVYHWGRVSNELDLGSIASTRLGRLVWDDRRRIGGGASESSICYS
jgi:hypothetical protein